MKVVITYDNGRVDVFDDGRFTAAQPFGSNAMLANYELRFDRLGQRGRPEPQGAEDGSSCSRRRKRFRMWSK